MDNSYTHFRNKIGLNIDNKNQVYVNLSEIDAKSFNVIKEDKNLNRQFYQEAYDDKKTP